MRRVRQAALGAALLAMVGLQGPSSAASPPKRPNILVIVADDLGWSDLGAFGGEIETPNLDALARDAVRLTDFHTSPTCSPTRAMLLTGVDNHLAGLGSMAENVTPNQRGKPGYEGALRTDVATIAERLGDAGYRTVLSGKWHLGNSDATDPHVRGFQHTFALRRGGGNHFGQPFGGGSVRDLTYSENGRLLDQLWPGFYSSDAFSDKLIEHLEASRKGGGADKPFFAYLAFTAPHFPLQAPTETIAKYRGRYDGGYEHLREQRLTRQKRLGLVPTDATVHPFEQGKAKPWARLARAERIHEAPRMEVYAAMVDRMDAGVGRVLAHLRRTGELDNTVVVFLSDNGAEGVELSTAGLESFRRLGSFGDNRVENYGTATSSIGYGPGWALAASAPSFLYKGYQTEGGTRVTAFVRPAKGTARPRVSGAYGSVKDLAPTLLDLAGVSWGGTTFRGRAVRPITGRSWRAHLAGAPGEVHGPADIDAGELFGQGVVRQGDWKLVQIGAEDWRLFHIGRDSGETRNLADAEPQRFASLRAAYDRYAASVGVVPPEPRVAYPD